jgi:hypothetical protein
MSVGEFQQQRCPPPNDLSRMPSFSTGLPSWTPVTAKVEPPASASGQSSLPPEYTQWGDATITMPTNQTNQVAPHPLAWAGATSFPERVSCSGRGSCSISDTQGGEDTKHTIEHTKQEQQQAASIGGESKRLRIRTIFNDTYYRCDIEQYSMTHTTGCDN